MLWLKHLHITCAALSATLFLLRVGYRWHTGRPPATWWGRRLPDMNDSLLLLTGATMMVRLGWWPWVVPWLGAKLLALVVYIALGAIALRRGSLLAAAAAMATFGYIVAVAITQQPLP